MSKRNKAAVLEPVAETEQVTPSEQPEEQPATEPEQPSAEAKNWDKESDSKIVRELESRIKAGADKDNTSGKIRELRRMGLEIKHIVKLLSLNQFQHAYVVLRKAGLVTPVTRTPVGTCIDCGKPIYTQESLYNGRGTLCRGRHTATQGSELEEDEPEA